MLPLIYYNETGTMYILEEYFANKGRNMTKIRNKITLAILSSILITTVVLSTISVSSTLDASIETTKATLQETATIAAQTASNTIANYTVAVGEIASNEILVSSESSKGEKQDLINEKIQTYYMRSGSMLDADGVDIFTGEDFSTSSFYTGAKEGGAYFSEPYISDDATDAYIAVSAPVVNNDQLIGVLYFYCDTFVLQNLVENIGIGDSGSAYILDGNGTTIAYNDYSVVLSQENAIQQAQTDASLADLAAIEQQMIKGESGVGSYDYNGVSEYQAYAPIPGTNGWSVAVTSTESELLQAAFDSIIVIAIVGVIMIALGFALAIYTSSSIGNPIVTCVNRLNALAKGDLTSPVPTVKSKDETHQLSQSTEAIITNLSEIIFDLDSSLSKMANGELNIDIENSDAYIGDYSSLHASVVKIADSLSTTMEQINNATAQVSLGSAQVADGAQVLAQGATEQSSAVEELAATIELITEKIEQTERDAQEASNSNEKSQLALAQSNEQMTHMLTAMQGINDKATKISNIVKAIDDIAFQTNILALNAAVEAARAGASGKGFAVVADEVRSLAAKSAESAKSTTLLIEETIAVVKNGNAIASQTSDSIAAVGENATELSGLVNRITSAIADQAESTKQINMGISQISSVVQSNTATAEESAATSHELSNQANTLKTLVGRFKF